MPLPIEKPSYRSAACSLLVLLFLFILAINTQAAAEDTSGTSSFTLGIESEYSDNIFELSDEDQSRLEDNNADDGASGRYDDMDSVTDLIVSPSLAWKYAIPGIAGEASEFSARLKYNYYTENQAKSYPEARLKLQHAIGAKGTLSLEGNAVFAYFKKNYLSDYDDANSNGNISRDERIYSAAHYDEYEGILAYTHEVYKNKQTILTRFDVKPFLGLSTRIYDNGFENRDRTIALGGLAFNVELYKRFAIELIYQYEELHTPGDNELILYDETSVGSDINGDGNVAGNAALETRIDRSAQRQTLEIKPTVKLTKNSLLFLGYEYRVTDYTSNNPLDGDHYDNSADRHKISAGMKYKFSKTWAAKFALSQTDETDDNDEEYRERCAALSLKYSL